MFPEGRALEFLVAAVVALIAVGPKDLPVLLRKLGQFMAKVRSMAAEFRASFDEMARQSELDELRKEVEAMRKGQLLDTFAASSSAAQTTVTLTESSHPGLFRGSLVVVTNDPTPPGCNGDRNGSLRVDGPNRPQLRRDGGEVRSADFADARLPE